MSTNVSGFPKRSEAGLGALDIFYSGFNEISFYVEDEDQENLYYVILKEVFGDIDFAKIFPLNGKANVISHAKDEVNKMIPKRVYIVDKDFDDLLGSIDVSVSNLIYLDRYCIENYLIQKDALVEFVVESQPGLKREDIAERLDFDSSLSKISDDLMPLFAKFFFIQLLDLGILNTGSKPEKFCSQGQLWKVCPNLCQDYVNKINQLCEENALFPITLPIETDTRLKSFYEKEPHEVIGGKFWLAMVLHYIRSHYNVGTVSFESFAFRVAKNCSFDNLENLSAKVRGIDFDA